MAMPRASSDSRPAVPRKETLEVDMTWLEGEDSAERLLIEAIRSEAAKGKKSIPPGPRRAAAEPRRSTKSMPAARKSAANIPAKSAQERRVIPPALAGASARRETLEVRADWLIEEQVEASTDARKRASKPPPATQQKRRAIPPPLPREDKD